MSHCCPRPILHAIHEKQRFSYLTGYVRVRQTFWPVKFLTPLFFLKIYWTYATKWGSVKRSHPQAPRGARGAFKGSDPQKQENSPPCQISKGIFFFLHGIIQDINADSLKSEKSGSGPFLIHYTQKTGEKGQNVKQKKDFVSGWIFNFVSIFNHFDQEDLEFPIKTLMKPI